MGTARLELELTNASGGDLNDFVRVELFATSTSNHYQNNLQVRRSIAVRDIAANASTVYRVALTPANYRLVQFFVMLGDGRTASQTVAFPVDPARVTGLQAPAFGALRPEAQGMLTQSEIPRFLAPDGSFRQGSDLYTFLDGIPRLKACFLNIVAKSAASPLRDGSSCLDHYSGMIRMEQDRLFIRTHAALREEVQNSPLFHGVSADLHDPVPGYTITDSFKSLDRYGNLQLTFQRRGSSGDDYVADVDIDDAQGIEHIFQVLRNSISGPTNPYDIHDILVKDQGLDPGYSFKFAQAAVVSRLAAAAAPAQTRRKGKRRG
jgi:hypothetical protein